MAAMVASAHMTATLSAGSTKVSVIGKRNKANPVILFNTLCIDISFFLRTKTNAILNILIKATMLIHTHSHTGM
jgi:hypothetical protein